MNERLHLQRRKAAPAADRAPRTALHVKLATPAPGQPLDSAARAVLEPRFGHNFADVRVHADSQADQLAQEVEARAFTTGQHIYFSASTYDPASPGGLHLLAHELTHTIQQANGPVSGSTERDGVAISDPGDSFERAADATADSIFSGAAVPAMASGGMAAGGVAVQRDEKNRDPRFQLVPPQLQLPLGPVDLQANTSSAQLGYTNAGFNANLGYNYGGDMYAGMRDDGFKGQLGLNPGSGALSLSGSYDQFKLGANADPSGKFGLNLHYGAPLPNVDAFSQTMQTGGVGLTNAVGALPGAFGDPIGYANAQGSNISSAVGAFGAARDLAGRPAGPSFGLDASVSHTPASAMSPEDWRGMLTVGGTF